MLAISFISAVNRKRKKRREARGLGSSTDDDSEQEAHKPEAGAPAPRAQDRPEGQRRNIFRLQLRTREGISEEEEIVIKKVMVPQGRRGGGKSMFEALWGLPRQGCALEPHPY